MSESPIEMENRVLMMAQGHGDWDLSPNDCAALAHVLMELGRAREAAAHPEPAQPDVCRISGEMHVEGMGTLPILDLDPQPDAAALVREVEGLRAALGEADDMLVALTHCHVCSGSLVMDAPLCEHCHDDGDPMHIEANALIGRIRAVLATSAAPVRTADAERADVVAWLEREWDHGEHAWRAIERGTHIGAAARRAGEG